MNAVRRLRLALAMLIPSPLLPRRAAAAIASQPPVLPHSAPPATGDQPPPTVSESDIVAEARARCLEAATRAEAAVAELERVRDLEEDARFRADIERDALLGDDANWPHV